MAEKKPDLRRTRLKKLHHLRGLGLDPFPSKVSRQDRIIEAKGQKSGSVSVAGRLMALRTHGGAAFGDLRDESGLIQVLFKEDRLKNYRLLEDFDIGDFFSVKGELLTTKAGELTIEVSEFSFLSKSLRPLPEKWHGLRNVEERYRKRYLDLLMNDEVKNSFLIRSQAVATIRAFLESAGFLEVETPILQSIAGGANARPFKTRYNAYKTDVFLRVAPELYLKRLIVGGFEKVFEFARCFRNEGVDFAHNPEFTNLEFYWAYADWQMMMDFVEELIVDLAKKTLGQTELIAGGEKILLKRPFARKTFNHLTAGKKTDADFKTAIKMIREPTFVTNHPAELLPLAKKADSQTVESFQLIVGGLEIVKAFSELNDPIDQRERFEAQEELRDEGDLEAQRTDEDFIEALEYGMPPTAGCGIGIDRLVTLLTGYHTLREIILFPYMRPRA